MSRQFIHDWVCLVRMTKTVQNNRLQHNDSQQTPSDLTENSVQWFTSLTESRLKNPPNVSTFQFPGVQQLLRCVKGQAGIFKCEISLASYLKCRGPIRSDQIRSDQWSTMKHNLKPAQQLQVVLTGKKKKKKNKSGLTRSGLQRAPSDK